MVFLDNKIEDILYEDSGLFRDINVFDVHYVPKEFFYRSHQMKALTMNIKPVFHGGGPIHTIILGDHATGKTTAILKLFEIINKMTDNLIPIYVNCKTYNTKFKTYSQIYKKVFGFESAKKGISATILFDKIMKKIKEEEKILLVALDDVNYLINNTRGHELFYELVRAYETFNVKIGLFPILSSLEFRYKFDKDIRTIFIPQEIVFPHYTHEEIYGILKERACVGFYDNVIDQEILLRVADVTKESNNLRLGLNILRTLGILAESGSRCRITIEHFNQLIKTKKKYI